MRNLIFLLIVLAIGIGVLGYYQGWFHVGSDHIGDNKLEFNVTVDKDKFREDTEKAKQKVTDLKNQAVEKTKEQGDKDKPSSTKPQ